MIGKTARRVLKTNAYDYVAGYTVANDYAIRDYLENYYRPNFRVKSRDCATPLGPWLVDAADVADPMNLHLRTLVNGRVTQEGNTRDMIFDIPALIAYLSEFMTLSPGDIILTGTPEGLADVEVGDEVVTEIEGIGSLKNTIIGDPEEQRMLDEISIRDAAKRLDESERARTQIRQLSIQHPAMTIDDAYAVQKAWVGAQDQRGPRSERPQDRSDVQGHAVFFQHQ